MKENLNAELQSLLTPIKADDFDIHQDIELLSPHHPHLCYIANGESDGNKFTGLPTIVAVDNNGNPSNGFSYLKEGTDKYQNLLKYNGEAIPIGSLSDLQGSEPLQVCIGIQEALTLHQETKKPVICLPSFNPTHYKKMINHFGEKYTLKIFGLLTEKRKIVKELSDCEFNGQLCLTITPLFDIAMMSASNPADSSNSIDFNSTISDAEQTTVLLFNGKVSKWGEIGDLSNGQKVKQPYPIRFFGDNLRAVIEKIAHYTETELPMAGQCVLGALSTIAQRHVNAPMDYGHVPAGLFLLTEGVSGGGKTRVNNLAYKAIMDRDKRKYKEYIEQYKKTPAGEEKPKNPVMLMTDVTVEKVIDRAVDDDIKNLSLVSDEGGNFFGGHSMKANTVLNALGNLTKMYSNSPISRFRSTRGDNKEEFKTTAYDCRLTIDFQAQPIVIEEVMKNEILKQQGFLARCLFASDASKIGKRTFNTGNPYQDRDLISYWERCEALMRGDHIIPFDCGQGSSEACRHNMPFANECVREYLNEYRRALEARLAEGGKWLQHSSFVSRLAENATRVATIVAFFEGSDVVDMLHLKCGIAVAEFSINEVLSYGGNEFTESEASKLLTAIHKKTSSENNSILYSKIQNGSRLRKSDLEPLLQELADNNIIQVLKRNNKRFIMVNPNSYPEEARKTKSKQKNN